MRTKKGAEKTVARQERLAKGERGVLRKRGVRGKGGGETHASCESNVGRDEGQGLWSTTPAHRENRDLIMNRLQKSSGIKRGGVSSFQCPPLFFQNLLGGGGGVWGGWGGGGGGGGGGGWGGGGGLWCVCVVWLV